MVPYIHAQCPRVERDNWCRPGHKTMVKKSEGNKGSHDRFRLFETVFAKKDCKWEPDLSAGSPQCQSKYQI